MVDVVGDVLAHRAVDGPAVVELEQIFVLDRVVFFLLRIQQRPKIADDFGALLDRFGGEEAKSGGGAADAIGFVRWDSRHDDQVTDALVKTRELRSRPSRTIPWPCQVFRVASLNLPQIAHVRWSEFPAKGGRMKRVPGSCLAAIATAGAFVAT